MISPKNEGNVGQMNYPPHHQLQGPPSHPKYYDHSYNPSIKKKEHIPWNENLSKNPYSSVQIDPGSSPFKIISKKDKISFHPDTKDLIWR